MRERLLDLEVVDRRRGITPARAGKTYPHRSTARPEWDHPRSCGKDLSPLYICNLTTGITPARAGKTVLFNRCFDSGQDHPRSCGKDGEVVVIL